MRLGCFVCAVAAALALPGWALAQADGEGQSVNVTLEYTAAERCPDADAFQAIIVGRLGHDAFRGEAESRVAVRIQHHERVFEGQIEWRDARGHWLGDRTFRSRNDDCADLARAMAFALALQIQLLATGKPPPAPAPSPPAVTAPSPDAKTEATTPSPNRPSDSERPIAPAIAQAAEPANRPHPTFGIAAGSLVGFGMSSSPVAFARIAGSLAWALGSVEGAAEVAWPTTTYREDGAGFSQQLLLGELAGCGQVRWLGACLLAKAGAIRVAGRGIDAPTEPVGVVLQAGVRLGLQQDLGQRIYVAAYAEGLVNLRPWKVVLDNSVVWSSPRFAEVLGLDVGLHFR